MGEGAGWGAGHWVADPQQFHTSSPTGGIPQLPTDSGPGKTAPQACLWPEPQPHGWDPAQRRKSRATELSEKHTRTHALAQFTRARASSLGLGFQSLQSPKIKPRISFFQFGSEFMLNENTQKKDKIQIRHMRPHPHPPRATIVNALDLFFSRSFLCIFLYNWNHTVNTVHSLSGAWAHGARYFIYHDRDCFPDSKCMICLLLKNYTHDRI